MAPDISTLTPASSLPSPGDSKPVLVTKTVPTLVDTGEYERQRLVERCRGLTVHVQNLLSTMPAWPKNLHSQEILDEANAEIDEWLKTVNVPQIKKFMYRETHELLLLTSASFSDCPKDKLVVLTKYHYWIFSFDDEIDTGGAFSADAAATRRICDETLLCVDEMLGRDAARAAARAEAAAAVAGSVGLLYEVLAAVRAAIGPATAERLRRDLHAFVEGVAREQAVRAGGRLPDPFHLFDLRRGDVGAAPSMTLNEYAMGFELPDAVRHHEAVEAIVSECICLTILVNEIHSCQKEFRAGQLENMCLLMVHHENVSITEGVARVIGLMRKHYAACEAAVARLPWTDDEGFNEKIREFVRGCRRIATGTGHWAYLNHRYFKPSQLNDKWGLTFTLDC